jgi:hypothetical protein
MLYWSDSIDAQPTGLAQRFAPSLYTACHKCWATCSKKRDCCYWMHCWSEEHSLENWRAYNYPHVTTYPHGGSHPMPRMHVGAELLVRRC